MRIMHISDTHGRFPNLYGRYDVVVHTGDLFPNGDYGNKNLEMAFQLQWLRQNAEIIKSWLGGHPFLYVPGNHDFLASSCMELELRAIGLEVFDLTDKTLKFQDVNFFGFPYVPLINGMWNYERDLPEMQDQVQKMVLALNEEKVDVLCCHAPIHGTLDQMIDQAVGCSTIANALDYKVAEEMLPQYYLCGHIHEANGVAVRNGMVVSNAATTKHIIQI
jgi:Icc-related predicted phosphoesterase